MNHPIGVGSDIEFFVAREGKVVSVIGKLGGTKSEPQATPNGFVQEDGILAEMNTIPAYTQDEFLTNYKLVEGDLDHLLAKKGLCRFTRASLRVDASELRHPLARRAGCSEDYNSWTYQMNDRPVFKRTNLRTAAGHVHMSWAEETYDINRQYKTSAAMDLFHAVPGVLIEEPNERRQLYGKAGSCRPKKYGVEFRTSSNWWTTDDERVRWTFDSAIRAVNEWDNPEIQVHKQNIQRAINDSDKHLCEQLVRTFNIQVPM